MNYSTPKSGLSPSVLHVRCPARPIMTERATSADWCARARRKMRSNKKAVTTAGEAEKHVEGQKVVFTAVPVAADPIVILVDLDEIFSTSIGLLGGGKVLTNGR